jgi:tRNA(Ile)-lysidine synthase
MKLEEKNEPLEHLKSYLLELILLHKKIFVAYSGGVDSQVLLHFIYKLNNSLAPIELTAIHVNHNLSPQASVWEEHCRNFCQNLGINFIAESIDSKLNFKGRSLEELLRQKRYQIFAKILPPEALLVTAHQADDQAETLLLQLFRGAGPKGLAAMPKKTNFAHGFLARPLLTCARNEIVNYATKYNLSWLEDETNLNPKFDRNFIRHQLFPLVKKKWPAIVTTLNRAANHCAESNELLEFLGAQDLQQVVANGQKLIAVELLSQFSLLRQKNLLRLWLHQLGLPLPSEIKLLEIIRTVVNSRYDAIPKVTWLGAELRRFRGFLYAFPPLISHDNKAVLSLTGNSLQLPAGLGTLIVTPASGYNINFQRVKVKFRQGGERITIPGRKGSKELKKMMQEWNIPPWLRSRVPLVYHDNQIVAVPGYYNVDWVKVVPED